MLALHVKNCYRHGDNGSEGVSSVFSKKKKVTVSAAVADLDA